MCVAIALSNATIVMVGCATSRQNACAVVYICMCIVVLCVYVHTAMHTVAPVPLLLLAVKTRCADAVSMVNCRRAFARAGTSRDVSWRAIEKAISVIEEKRCAVEIVLRFCRVAEAVAQVLHRNSFVSKRKAGKSNNHCGKAAKGSCALTVVGAQSASQSCISPSLHVQSVDATKLRQRTKGREEKKFSISTGKRKAVALTAAVEFKFLAVKMVA